MVVVVVVVVVVGHYEAHSRVSVYQPTFTYWWLVRLGLDRNCQPDYKTWTEHNRLASQEGGRERQGWHLSLSLISHQPVYLFSRIIKRGGALSLTHRIRARISTFHTKLTGTTQSVSPAEGSSWKTKFPSPNNCDCKQGITKREKRELVQSARFVGFNF